MRCCEWSGKSVKSGDERDKLRERERERVTETESERKTETVRESKTQGRKVQKNTNVSVKLQKRRVTDKRLRKNNIDRLA